MAPLATDTKFDLFPFLWFFNKILEIWRECENSGVKKDAMWHEVHSALYLRPPCTVTWAIQYMIHKIGGNIFISIIETVENTSWNCNLKNLTYDSWTIFYGSVSSNTYEYNNKRQKYEIQFRKLILTDMESWKRNRKYPATSSTLNWFWEKCCNICRFYFAGVCG
jgi:hypothetical protein